MGQLVHFIKDLGFGHEGGGANLRSARMADTADE